MAKTQLQPPSRPTKPYVSCWIPSISVLDRSSSFFLKPRKAPKPEESAPRYIAPAEYPTLESPSRSRNSSISTVIARPAEKSSLSRRISTKLQHGLQKTKRILLCGAHHHHEPLPDDDDEKPRFRSEKISTRRISNPISPPPEYRFSGHLSEVSLAPSYQSTRTGARQWLNGPSRHTWMGFLNETVFETPDQQEKGRSKSIDSDAMSLPEAGTEYQFEDNYGDVKVHLLASRFSATTISTEVECPLSKHVSWPMYKGKEEDGEAVWIMTGIRDKQELQRRLAEYFDDRMEDFVTPCETYGYI